MNPDKVVRGRVGTFTDLPNIGPAMARDFAMLGFDGPAQLADADPLDLYVSLCREKHRYQDPCVLDVFMSVTDFLAGNPARPWWHFTETRKRRYAAAVLQARRDFA